MINLFKTTNINIKFPDLDDTQIIDEYESHIMQKQRALFDNILEKEQHKDEIDKHN